MCKIGELVFGGIGTSGRNAASQVEEELIFRQMTQLPNNESQLNEISSPASSVTISSTSSMA
jgi:hypothetical protein